MARVELGEVRVEFEEEVVRVECGEGVVGKAAASNKTIEMSNLPDSYKVHYTFKHSYIQGI